jgi:hypothetical protein
MRNADDAPTVREEIVAHRETLLRSRSFVHLRELVNYRRACLADNLVLGVRASRTTDCADNHPLLDQRNAAARRNDSIEREQIVETHKLDAVLEDLGWAPEGCCCSCLMFRYLNGMRASRRPFVGRQLNYHRNRLLQRSSSISVSSLLPQRRQ